MSGIDHQDNDTIRTAARWLADQPVGSVRPTVPTLQARFGISPRECCEAISLAGKMRMLRSAFA